MPTIDDAKRAPPGHHWPPGSLQAEQLAREQRDRELALYEKYAAEYERLRAEAAPAAQAEQQQPETPLPPNELNSGAK